MSMSESGLSPAPGLTPEQLAQLERIRVLAAQNRRQYATEQSGKRKGHCVAATVKPAAQRKSGKPAKQAKPYFYNPAQRD